MDKNNIKIYCKFNDTKPTIDKVICKMFYDYVEKKNTEKNYENDILFFLKGL